MALLAKERSISTATTNFITKKKKPIKQKKNLDAIGGNFIYKE